MRAILLTLILGGCAAPVAPNPPIPIPCSHIQSGPPGCICAQHYTDDQLLHLKVPCP